jgi:hypothetical protein
MKLGTQGRVRNLNGRPKLPLISALLAILLVAIPAAYATVNNYSGSTNSTGCNNTNQDSSISGNFNTPATTVYVSWSFPSHVSDGISPFCVNEGVTSTTVTVYNNSVSGCAINPSGGTTASGSGSVYVTMPTLCEIKSGQSYTVEVENVYGDGLSNIVVDAGPNTAQ